MTLIDDLQGYALDPTPARLAVLHRRIMDDPAYDPLALISAGASPGEAPAAVLDRVGALMPGALLSPSAHAQLAGAHAQRGEADASRREQQLARLALHSLRTAGDGTPDSPYRVLRIEDEYDLLLSLGLRSRARRQVADPAGDLDVHTVEDGTELWIRLLWRTPATV